MWNEGRKLGPQPLSPWLSPDPSSSLWDHTTACFSHTLSINPMFPQMSPAIRSHGFTAAESLSSTPRKWSPAALVSFYLWTEGSRGRKIRPHSPPPGRMEVTPHHSPRHPGEQPWSAALCPLGPSEPWGPAASVSLAAIPLALSCHLPAPVFSLCPGAEQPLALA